MVDCKVQRGRFFKLRFRDMPDGSDGGVCTCRVGRSLPERLWIELVKEIINIQVAVRIFFPVGQKHIVSAIADRQKITPVPFTILRAKRFHPPCFKLCVFAHGKHKGLRLAAFSRKKKVTFRRILPGIGGEGHVAFRLKSSLNVLIVGFDDGKRALFCAQMIFGEPAVSRDDKNGKLRRLSVFQSVCKGAHSLWVYHVRLVFAVDCRDAVGTQFPCDFLYY